MQKFINVWLSLPRSSGKYQQDDGAQYLQTSIIAMTENGQVINSTAVSVLKSLVKHLSPSFRDIERILTYFAIIENSHKEAMSETYQNMMAVICFVKVMNPKLLDAVMGKRAGSKELLEELHLLNDLELTDEYMLEYVANEIEFDLASDSRRQEMTDDKTIPGARYGRLPSNVLDYFYQELKSIQPVR